jgi:hypothetical protein
MQYTVLYASQLEGGESRGQGRETGGQTPESVLCATRRITMPSPRSGPVAHHRDGQLGLPEVATVSLRRERRSDRPVRRPTGSSSAAALGRRAGPTGLVAVESGQQKVSGLPGEGIPPRAAGRSRAARRPCTLLITDPAARLGEFPANSLVYTIVMNGLAMHISGQ